jgi:magnesium chelatase subunit D
LAGCASNEAGMVSPHLLDRFALRLSGGLIQPPQDRVKEILSLIDNQTLGAQSQVEPLSTEIKETLQKAIQFHPQITNEAITKILNYTSNLEIYSQRREIALVRLSNANARLDNAAKMTEKYVDAAANMIGLQPVVQIQKPNISSELAKPEPLETKNNIQPQPSTKPKINTITDTLPFYESDESETLAPTPIITQNSIDPYPEDSAPVEREVASLRLPSRRFQNKSIARGVIIGVEKAKNLQDIALVRTLLEAAKFQPVRQAATRNGNKLLILSPTDLYSYRRAPVAEQMLTLVLDHTCLQDYKWQDELLPYLSWAYVERASVCLVQIGAANARNELQAEKIIAQSILVPSINAGIEAEAGKATPLAHGLDLALQTLRHALQHGRSMIKQAMLVVITDGRGNIPLEASRTYRIIPPVGRKGVEDALQVAERIRGLDGVKAVLLNPQSKQYPEIPLELAKALGAKVVLIPEQQTWELE